MCDAGMCKLLVVQFEKFSVYCKNVIQNNQPIQILFMTQWKLKTLCSTQYGNMKTFVQLTVTNRSDSDYVGTSH